MNKKFRSHIQLCSLWPCLRRKSQIQRTREKEEKKSLSNSERDLEQSEESFCLCLRLLFSNCEQHFFDVK
jgi:hypothetical protein